MNGVIQKQKKIYISTKLEFSRWWFTHMSRRHLIFLGKNTWKLTFNSKGLIVLAKLWCRRKKQRSVMKSCLKKDSETTDRHRAPGRGCRVWCPAWRRGWRWPLCWTETRCLCAAPAWLGEEQTLKATQGQLFHNEQSVSPDPLITAALLIGYTVGHK